MKEYIDFLKSKMALSHLAGFTIEETKLAAALFPYVKDSVRWAMQGGSRVIFCSFGMQMTVTQLEILRIILWHKGVDRMF